MVFQLKRGRVKIFKLRNRSGYAALYQNNLTEGRTADQAFARMVKAARRKPKRR
jgi:hypothetical protein